MKKWKRMIAFVLTVCMVLSLLPPVQIAHAAETIRRYELDTDGIDPGATYLIVNAGAAGSGHALRFYYSSMWSRDLRDQTVTIQKEDKENGITYIRRPCWLQPIRRRWLRWWIQHYWWCAPTICRPNPSTKDLSA